MNVDRTLQPWLDQLRHFPWVGDLRFKPQTHDQKPDGLLEIQVNGRWQPFHVEHKRAPRLNEATIHQVERWKRLHPEQQWILFANHVTPRMGERLTQAGIHYLDRQGNCDLRIPGERLFIHVEGKRPATAPATGRGIGAPGYRILFALLARQELVGATIRAVAAAAEVPKTTAGEMLERLREEAFILRVRGEEVIVRRDELLERWITGYADVLRPRLLVGAYRTNLGQDEFEDRVERGTLGLEWAWGGGTAAARMTRHYRGEGALLHCNEIAPGQLQAWNALPARAGNLTVVAPPCAIGLQGVRPHLAHPLLVYTELLIQRDERARETAELVRTMYMDKLE